MSVASLTLNAWSDGHHKVNLGQATSCMFQQNWPGALSGSMDSAVWEEQHKLASLLLLGMSLMGKILSFQGAFTSAILQEAILANCTECVCLKNPEEIVSFYTLLVNT